MAQPEGAVEDVSDVGCLEQSIVHTEPLAGQQQRRTDHRLRPGPPPLASARCGSKRREAGSGQGERRARRKAHRSEPNPRVAAQPHDALVNDAAVVDEPERDERLHLMDGSGFSLRDLVNGYGGGGASTAR